MLRLKPTLAILISSISLSACAKSEAGLEGYVWQQVTESASYQQSYNYPVFVMNGQMLAMNNGAWVSTDGKTWTKTALPDSGLNSGYQKYVQLNDAVYSLGSISGNYQRFTVSTRILRTRDGKTWETVADQSNLPQRIFYSTAVFKNRMWLIGGYDGHNYLNDVWNSEDGVKWQRVLETAPWSPRQSAAVVLFKNRLWMFGGGVIDGDKEINPESYKEVWSSADGINWTREKLKTERSGGTPIVFDNKLWFVGANRNDGSFGNAVTVSDDGVTWQAQSAPWSPRGGVAVWVFDNRLFMTGGKYSYTEANGETKFVYSNDVWVMSKKTE
jgi:hypothetical protein